MKKILLLFLIGFIFGQTDNIGSEPFNETADHLFHSGRDKAFSDGTILFKSSSNRVDVDSSALWISDSTAGTRASGMFLLQEGDTIYSSAADLNLLSGFVDSNYTIIIDSSGYLLNVPRTVYGWGHDLTFSATDHNTIAWTSGYLYFANLDTFEIVSGNTGDISDPTWIYFDEDVSATVLQTTTEAGNSVGLGRIIVCVAEDVVSGKDAIFQVFGGVGSGVFIVADNIAANTITTNLLAANSVTTNEILFGSLNQDSLIASINADENGLYINAENIQIGGATTFTTGYNPADGSMVLYQISAPSTRPSGDALQNGDSWVDTTAAEGNVPRVWTGSEWRVAFTYIHGGYIKTGTVDTDRLNVADIITAGSLIVSGDNVSDLTNDNLYITTFVQAGEPTANGVGDIWIETDDNNQMHRWDGSNWIIYQDGDISDAQDLLDDMADGGEVTPSEKVLAKQMWDIIVAEKSGIDSQADAFGISKTAYDYDYSELNYYLNTNILVFDDMYGTTSIARNIWDQKWGNYYDERTSILQAIATQGKDLADSKMKVIRSDAQPNAADYNDGDIWIDTDDGDAPYINVSSSSWVRANTHIDGGHITTGTIDANRIDVSGVITAGSIVVGGDNVSDLINDENFRTVVRADAEPTYTDYNVGDIWIDTSDGDRPRSRGASGWVEMLTIIDGGHITTGTIDASVATITNINATNINTGTLDADYIEVSGIFAKDMEISGSGEIHSTGKDSYGDNDAGFWLGDDGGTWKMNIGNISENLKWDGLALYINDAIVDDLVQTSGTITGATIQTAIGNVDKVILDVDGVRIYDYAAGNAAKLWFYKEGGPAGRIHLDEYDMVYFSYNPGKTLHDFNGLIRLSHDQKASIEIRERITAPTHVSDYGTLWVQEVTSTPLRYTTDDDQDLYVVTAIARTTLPGTTWEGRIVIDTDDNIAYIYADGGWRIIASGW